MTAVSAKMTMSDPTTRSRYQSLMNALQKYLDMMYDCDTSRFDDVFRPTVHLHGFRDGEMKAWSADAYKEILNKRQSPKSQHARRFCLSDPGARQSAPACRDNDVCRLSHLALH
jgi:hypothetical protein